MAPVTFVLYSRPGCHLCELLLEQLRPLLASRAEVEIVDVSRDPDLERRYGLRIPVLAHGDIELSAYPLDTAGVDKYLTAATEAAVRSGTER